MAGRKTETMIRDAQFLEQHIAGVPHGKIAEDFGVSEQTVHVGVRRAIGDKFRLEVDEMRVVEDERLNWMMRRLTMLLRHPQYKIGNTGKIVVGPDGKPLVDTSEERQIMMAMEKISASRRKLHGLDMPIKHRVEITDKMDAEIEKLASELAMNGPGAVVPLEAVNADGDGDSSA